MAVGTSATLRWTQFLETDIHVCIRNVRSVTISVDIHTSLLTDL